MRTGHCPARREYYSSGNWHVLANEAGLVHIAIAFSGLRRPAITSLIAGSSSLQHSEAFRSSSRLRRRSVLAASKLSVFGAAMGCILVRLRLTPELAPNLGKGGLVTPDVTSQGEAPHHCATSHASAPLTWQSTGNGQASAAPWSF